MSTGTVGSRRLHRRMLPRGAAEVHRAATPLELFFDLCFVVAVAQAAGRLHHAVSEAHLGDGVLRYLMVFFAIWWAWMNFTWFASAYDTDDVAYRLATFVQIAGALVIAAGIPRAFDTGDFLVVVIGYSLMRLALVGQWLRAARADDDGRRAAHRFALGVTLIQLGWISTVFLTQPVRFVVFPILVLIELTIPVWAERAQATQWHPGHIAERYGLFTLIVLGESVSAATIAVQVAADAGGELTPLVVTAACGLVIVFAMWWLYFLRPVSHLHRSGRTAFVWGYGHYFIFAGAAAVGAGLQATVDHLEHLSHASSIVVGYAVAIPVAVFLLSVWFLHVRPHRDVPRVKGIAFLATAGLVLLTPVTSVPLPLIALLLAALVALCVALAPRSSASG